MHKKSASLQGAFFVQHRFIIIFTAAFLTPAGLCFRLLL